MEWYLFELCYQNKDLTAGTNFHKELLANSSDAKTRANKVLQEGKRDCNAYLVTLYGKHRGDWKKIVSYQ
jgi:hypothetical protein